MKNKTLFPLNLRLPVRLAAFTLGIAGGLWFTATAWAGTITTNFTSSGTWTCPPGVTNISVAVQGGGGAGGAASTTSGERGGGGGGGGCAYSSALTVVPATVYTVTVGGGGAGGSGNGGAGGASSFSGTGITTLTANGGGGGGVNSGGGGAAGGGGTANYSGGNGAAGPSNATAGGAGGGGAGTTGAGGAGSGATGGTGGTGSPAGGTGASSPAPNHAGNPGGAPGGGGCGGYKGSTSVLDGGSGAAGQIVITYTPPASVSDTKANNTDNLNLTTSWTGGTVPSAVGLAIWDSTVQSPNGTVALGADLAFGGITITNPGVPVVISAGNTLTLNGPIDMSGATADLTLNCGLALGATSIWTVTNSHTLTVGGAVSGAFGISLQGAGTTILSSANTFSGTTTVGAGVLSLGDDLALQNSALDTTGLSGSAPTVTLSTTTPTFGGLIGSVDLATAISSGYGGVTALTLNPGSGSNPSYSGSIADGATGMTLTKSGVGTQTLAGGNTYSGATMVNGGDLLLNNIDAISNSAPVSVASGASLQLNAAGTYALTGTLSLVGPGLAGTSDPGALFFGSGGVTTATLNAPLALDGATTISSYGVTMNQILGGVIGGTGPLTIDSRGGANTHTAVWMLNATNSYTDNTTIFNDNGLLDVTVMLGATNALPTTTSVNLYGVTTMTGSIYATLDLNGFPQTLAGLTDTNSASLNGNGTFGTRVINSSGTPATLTINIASGTDTFGTTGTRVIAGTIGGTTAGLVPANNLSLVLTGPGTLVLAGANTYTGNTTVSAGTLQIDGSGVSPIEVQGGANLAGGGNTGAAVAVDDEGSVTAGDIAGGVLTVPNLTFYGTGTLNIGDPLLSYTNVAALYVTNALTLGGLEGGVTINLPTAAVANGTYHLIQFGSGITDTSGFALGTVPTPTAGQVSVLQLDGNYLDYVVTSPVVNNPPVLLSTIPANNATGVSPTAQLVANFNENVVAGSGSIELHQSNNGSLVASYDVTSSPQIGFSATQLIIQPTSNLLTNQQYYVLIPAGAVQDQFGNQFPGITTSSNWTFTVTVPPVLYIDTGSPTNPPWIQVSNTIASAGGIGENYGGPVYGSVIDVNLPAVEVGLYGDRPISVGSEDLHCVCNTAVGSSNFGKFTRWYQSQGNTEILRLFVGDINTATTRDGSSRTEAYDTPMAATTSPTTTYEWTGHYTLAHREQSYACFQSKNTVDDWAVQIEVDSGSVAVHERNGADTFVTNGDGSVADFDGQGFDARVLDDGLNYKVWINGVLYGSGSYSRPTGNNQFRWGSYLGDSILVPPADYNLIFVSGAQEKSYAGSLNAGTTAITKNNNTSNLDTGSSWVGGAAPGIHNLAVWNSTVTAANAATLASDAEWAGIQILNPGGPVTINGSDTIVLNASGVDLTAATQNLTVNCPVQMAVAGNWGVASGRTATFNGTISGYPGLTLTGGGTVNLGASNVYSGNTTISAGTLQLGANGGIPSGAGSGNVLLTGILDMNGFADTINGLSGTGTVDNTAAGNATLTVGGNNTSCTFNGNITNTAGNLTLATTGTGTVILSGTNGYSGATIVNGGLLQLGLSGAVNPVTIPNYSFELPALTNWAYGPIAGANWSFSTSAPGNSGMDPNTGIWYATPAPDGKQAAFIQADGSFSQFITVGSAGLYAITFQAEGRSGTHGPEGMIVQVDGVSVATWTATSVSQSQWQSYQATANLTAGNHTLTFVGNNTLGGDKSVAIDNVHMFQPLGTGLLPLATDVNLSGGLGATLDLSGAAQTIGSLAGAAGSLVINNGSLTSGSDGLSTSFAGVISGAGSFTKTGAGTQTFSGANTYAGGTTISNGTLLVNNSAGSGAVTVISGGTLGGTGAIAGNVTNSGTLLPGAAGAGTLTINGNLTLNAGSTNTFAINGSTLAQTSVALGGSATYGGVLNLVTSGTFTAGQTFTLFSGAGATNAGNFARLAGSPGAGLAFAFTNGVLSVVSAGPTLTGVSPNPVTGSSYPVTLGLAGSGFSTGSPSVWLTNVSSLTGANYVPIVNSDTGMTVSFVPGTASSSWTATVVDGGPSASVPFVVNAATPVSINKNSLRSAGAGNVVLSGTGGGINNRYAVESATNLNAPVVWVPLVTNTFDGSGNFNYTDSVAPGVTKLFLRLQQ